MKNNQQIIAGVIIVAVTVILLLLLPKPDNSTPKASIDQSLQLSMPQNQLAEEAKTNQSTNLPIAPKYSQPPPLIIDLDASYSAKLQTSVGPLTINLFTKEAPKTVNNFIFLAQEKFYDGTIFHRIIRDFMIQGGDPKGDGTGGPGYTFKDELISRDYTRGIVAMANSGPNTNGSQFFIMTQDTNLPKNYVIFGELSGEDSFKTLDTIASTPVTQSASGELSQPTQKITINSIAILKQ